MAQAAIRIAWWHSVLPEALFKIVTETYPEDFKNEGGLSLFLLLFQFQELPGDVFHDFHGHYPAHHRMGATGISCISLSDDVGSSSALFPAVLLYRNFLQEIPGHHLAGIEIGWLVIFMDSRHTGTLYTNAFLRFNNY